MGRRFWPAVAALALLIMPAIAEETKFYWKACDTSINWDVRIAACTVLIDDPKLTAADRAYAFFNRGFGWTQKRELDRALADYDASIRLDPNEHVYFYRGTIWASKGQVDRAIADYSQAIRLAPDFAEAYFYRSRMWRKKGDGDRAKADLDQAIKLDPKVVTAGE